MALVKDLCGETSNPEFFDRLRLKMRRGDLFFEVEACRKYIMALYLMQLPVGEVLKTDRLYQ